MFSAIAVPQEAAQRHRMVLVSLVGEAAMVAVIVVYPLIFPQDLPPPLDSTLVSAPVFSITESQEPIGQSETPRASLGLGHALVVRRHGFSFVRPTVGIESNESASAPGMGDVLLPGSHDGFLVGTISSNLMMPHPALEPHPRRSVLMEGNLIRKVEPEYPALAKQMRLEGTVVLKAVISPSGTVEKLEVQHGHPVLARAAIEAVRQWRYRPYLLNREPIEVETEITVKFLLSR